MNRLIGMTFAMLAGLAARDASALEQPSPLRGTWILVAADRILPGGEQVRDYGEHPKGRLIVDAAGRYSLQILKAERLRFAAEGKADGTPDEFKSAVRGSSTHYGTVSIDEGGTLLVFSIQGSSFPNWEGTVQKRQFTLAGDELSYRVPPRPDGSVPVSVWRREQ